ncbi:MAG: lysine 2,3-aminomutase [Bacteroidota bacterium]|nr:lysine 2,3-aminomutase [Bacteroidota bacterium]MDP3145680.1 lysine 2,3-aminomutase [Bacteroidota bacterium]MDP3558645.1 lysine 2,3-aminomutase [Bacteroidota bacterium]
MKLQSFALHNYKNIPQIAKLTAEQLEAIEVVGNVLPFKTNNYVVNELIDWDNLDNDPMFKLTFPQKGMLSNEHYDSMKIVLEKSKNRDEIKRMANTIRLELNPHPAGQMEHNVPEVNGEKLLGMQHKYRETVLFFPSQGQTCHAYCTFCFRWPQFVGMDEFKFATKEASLLKDYVKENSQVTDILFTGGDPMIMKAKIFASYIQPLLDEEIPNLQTIRIGTKALSYWPYKFTSDDDADELITLFDSIIKKGINLTIMAHFSHPVELETEAVKLAIKRLRSIGVQIRTQSPILKHINDSPEVWSDMWRKQVNLNCIPYYMFIPRDTGAQDYFAITLEDAWQIFRNAYQKVSGVCRTVRGPSMSCTPGKIQILGISEIKGEKIFVLRMLQGRNPDWVGRPFFAKYDKKAIWLDDLKPAFDEEKFFFEDELEWLFNEHVNDDEKARFE